MLFIGRERLKADEFLRRVNRVVGADGRPCDPGAADGVRECAEKLSLVFEKELAKM